MHYRELRKQFFELAKKIKQESDLGYVLEDLLTRRFPLEARARDEEKLERLLEELVFVYYTNRIYSNIGEKFPGFLLTEIEIILIKIEEQQQKLNLDFEHLENLFKEESHKSGFLNCNRFSYSWNDYQDNLKLEDFYNLAKRTIAKKKESC